MTDEELDSFEVAAKKMIETSCGPFASFYNEDFSKVILDLIAELRKTKQRCAQLSKERIYLAKCLEYNNGPDMRVSYYEYIARAKEATCSKN